MQSPSRVGPPAPPARASARFRCLQSLSALLALVVLAYTHALSGGEGGGGGRLALQGRVAGAGSPLVAAPRGGPAAGSGSAAASLQLQRGTQGCVGGADWFEARRRALGPPREPTIGGMSPEQRAANARVLVISSDTRPLARAWANRTYSSLSMILNRQYAQAHGYDFAFVRTFASSKPAGQFSGERDAACFHPGFGIWRVHNWCKVLTLWAAARARDPGGPPGRPLYDLVVYLDSDAIMQDLGGDVAETWAPHMGAVVFGAPFCAGAAPPGGGGHAHTLGGCTSLNGTGPLFVFYSDNVPGEPGSPNLGYFAMRTPPRTLAMLRDWWDFVDEAEGHKYAYYAFHEQTGMWRLMHRGWAGGVTVTATRWAPDELAKMVRHINSEENRYTAPRDFRVEKFSAHAAARYIAGEAFEEAMRDTIERCDAVDLDVMEMVRDMDEYPGPWVRDAPPSGGGGEGGSTWRAQV